MPLSMNCLSNRAREKTALLADFIATIAIKREEETAARAEAASAAVTEAAASAAEEMTEDSKIIFI